MANVYGNRTHKNFGLSLVIRKCFIIERLVNANFGEYIAIPSHLLIVLEKIIVNEENQ